VPVPVEGSLEQFLHLKGHYEISGLGGKKTTGSESRTRKIWEGAM